MFTSACKVYVTHCCVQCPLYSVHYNIRFTYSEVRNHLTTVLESKRNFYRRKVCIFLIINGSINLISYEDYLNFKTWSKSFKIKWSWNFLLFTNVQPVHWLVYRKHVHWQQDKLQYPGAWTEPSRPCSRNLLHKSRSRHLRYLLHQIHRMQILPKIKRTKYLSQTLNFLSLSILKWLFFLNIWSSKIQS